MNFGLSSTQAFFLLNYIICFLVFNKLCVTCNKFYIFKFFLLLRIQSLSSLSVEWTPASLPSSKRFSPNWKKSEKAAEKATPVATDAPPFGLRTINLMRLLRYQGSSNTKLVLDFYWLPRPEGESVIFWFLFIFSHNQRLRLLGYCAPYKL